MNSVLGVAVSTKFSTHVQVPWSRIKGTGTGSRATVRSKFRIPKVRYKYIWNLYSSTVESLYKFKYLKSSLCTRIYTLISNWMTSEQLTAVIVADTGVRPSRNFSTGGITCYNKDEYSVRGYSVLVRAYVPVAVRVHGESPAGALLLLLQP